MKGFQKIGIALSLLAILSTGCNKTKELSSDQIKEIERLDNMQVNTTANNLQAEFEKILEERSSKEVQLISKKTKDVFYEYVNNSYDGQRLLKRAQMNIQLARSQDETDYSDPQNSSTEELLKLLDIKLASAYFEPLSENLQKDLIEFAKTSSSN